MCSAASDALPGAVALKVNEKSTGGAGAALAGAALRAASSVAKAAPSGRTAIVAVS
jgi:hypothetical protein